MCGIIGYVGSRPCQELLLEGLRRLEYRGYDSAGIAWREGGATRCIRTVGNLDSLDAALACSSDTDRAATTATEVASAGIGHTRWATHGGVTKRNAHPHADASGRFKIVLNGIIENHLELRDRLAADLITLRSDTDAEVVAHLIAQNYAGSLADAVRRSLQDLEGHLLGPETPVVCVATDRRVLPKLLSNLSEVRARGAQVLAIASDGYKEIAEHAEHVIYIPNTDPLLQVVLGILPLQLFAYHVARSRGLNVDQPRNLAKTVTVE